MKNTTYRILVPTIALFLLFGLVKREKLFTHSVQAHQQLLNNQNQLNQPEISKAYGQLPMSFELNQGQTEPQVKYLARGRGYQVFLTDTEVVLGLRNAESGMRNTDLENRAFKNPQYAFRSFGRNPQSDVLRLKFTGAMPAGQIVGVDPLPGKSNYFIGNDPKRWRTNVPNYARVEYREVYPGIGLAYYGTQQALEYDFIVTPGADPQMIAINFEGAERIMLNAHGDLELHLNGNVIYQRSPVIYQQVDGKQRSVTGHYVIKGDKQVGFELGSYDAAKSLIIDPVLEYSTYLGGGGDDLTQSIKVDTSGNAYVTGVTAAADFPTKDGLQGASSGGLDAFVTKVNSNGTALVYSTYLGGSSDDAGSGIAVDGLGNAYVVGYTASTDFKTQNPLQAANRGDADAFIAKINPSGSQLVYSTYLGSSGEDIGFAIATDTSGNAYVTGYSGANDFNIQSALQQTYRGNIDAFVARINSTGSALSYSTYLGGADGDLGAAIAVDGAGNAYVSGYTLSTDFNTKDPIQTTNRGGLDGFVTKINSAGSALVYSTYLGGGGDDLSYGLTVDAAGNVYLTGVTESADFPTRSPYQSVRKGSSDAFATKINASGTDLLYSSYFGGDGADFGRGIAIDTASNIYLTGDSTSRNLPTKDPLQPANRGFSDAFIAKLNAAGSDLIYGTYLGGSRTDTGYGIAIDGAGNAYVTGSTDSLDFNLSNPIQSDKLGGIDSFIAKISADGSQLTYSTYLGGSGNDLGLSIAVDGAGNAYVTGFTFAADFPITNSLQPAIRGNSEAFAVKIEANGSVLGYSTYFGGSGFDQGLDIAVDQAGNAYVAGVTDSTNFSTSNPLQLSNRGGSDAFIVKLNATGNSLVYSTYFGGGGSDAGYSIGVDGGGSVYLAGPTSSINLTTQNPLQPANRGEDDAFVVKINAAGSAPIYSTYLGGSKSDNAYSITVDGAGNAYVAGVTASNDFNTKNALQGMNRGDLDAFVTKINNDGSALSYSTYLGGSGSDFGYSIAVDTIGNAYVTGATFSTDFNTKNPLQNSNKGGLDAFLTKIDTMGATLVYSTYLGGSNSDLGIGITVDALGGAHLTGNTASTDFPIKDAIQTTNRGGNDAFITKVNTGGSDLVFSTYLGGSGPDEGDSIAIDNSGNIYLTGQTSSPNFPIANEFQPAVGGIDAFILKISGTGGSGGTPVASVSAASYVGTELASESIVAAFGVELATDVQVASMLPLPTSLAGTSIKVKDSAGAERLASLFFVAPGQVNYQLPPEMAAGPALVTVTSGSGKVSTGMALISPVAPGLFSSNADGQGIAAAVALRVKADGMVIYESISRFDSAQNKFVSVPLDLGPEGEQVFLIMFGTGLRFRSSLSAVTMTVGGANAETLFAGAQGGFVGLDQINLRVPRSLVGRGDVDISMTVDGKPANVVKVNIK
jgi:uncharacterized protein (TIGR03437 family)